MKKKNMEERKLGCGWGVKGKRNRELGEADNLKKKKKKKEALIKMCVWVCTGRHSTIRQAKN